MRRRSAEDVANAYTDQLLSLPRVNGVSVEEDEKGRPYILVLVTKLDSRVRRRLPASLEGYKVRVKEIGEIYAQR